MRLTSDCGFGLWLSLVEGWCEMMGSWNSKGRLILAAVSSANPLNVCGAMCPSLCVPHKAELCWWFWAGAESGGRLVGAMVGSWNF